MDDEVRVLLCVPWDAWEAAKMQQQMPSLKRRCSKCGQAVAIDRRNVLLVAELKLALVCVPCWAQSREEPGAPEISEIRAIVGGREMSFREGAQTAQRDAFINKSRN